MLPRCESSVSQFTSLVLQHPANRLVKQVDVPSVVIVHQGWVDASGTVFVEEDASKFSYVSSLENDGMEIQPYNLESLRAEKSVKEWVSVQSRDRQVGWQGVVLKDGNGNRWRERSDVYETLRKLRGNESTTEERYARLRKMRTVSQYLAFYPNDKDVFHELERLLRKNTHTLFHFYVDTFRKRNVLFHELPWPYKHHVSVLHNNYKNVLRANKKVIDLEVVIQYVNNLSLEDSANMLKEHRLDLVKKDVPVPVVKAST
jgi:predicted CopG family antitoxin